MKSKNLKLKFSDLFTKNEDGSFTTKVAINLMGSAIKNMTFFKMTLPQLNINLQDCEDCIFEVENVNDNYVIKNIVCDDKKDQQP